MSQKNNKKRGKFEILPIVSGLLVMIGGIFSIIVAIKSYTLDNEESFEIKYSTGSLYYLQFIFNLAIGIISIPIGSMFIMKNVGLISFEVRKDKLIFILISVLLVGFSCAANCVNWIFTKEITVTEQSYSIITFNWIYKWFAISTIITYGLSFVLSFISFFEKG